jgi:hypothetical protein
MFAHARERCTKSQAQVSMQKCRLAQTARPSRQGSVEALTKIALEANRFKCQQLRTLPVTVCFADESHQPNIDSIRRSARQDPGAHETLLGEQSLVQGGKVHGLGAANAGRAGEPTRSAEP